MSLFLTSTDLRELTGYTVKAKQIAQLKRMGIAFFINGCGRPVVTVAAVEGRKKELPKQQGWQPAALGKAA